MSAASRCLIRHFPSQNRFGVTASASRTARKVLLRSRPAIYNGFRSTITTIPRVAAGISMITANGAGSASIHSIAPQSICAPTSRRRSKTSEISRKDTAMGWLFMSKYHMGGFHSPNAYLDAPCSYAPGSERTQGLRLLKSVWSGGEYYAAVQPYDETGAVEPVLAIVCLVRWNPKSTSGQHFGFKDMDEGMGPCEAKCPASVLDLLGPPRNEYEIGRAHV